MAVCIFSVLLYDTCAFAPGLSLPYPSSRLMTPHTARPQPMAITSTFNILIAELINAINTHSRIPCASLPPQAAGQKSGSRSQPQKNCHVSMTAAENPGITPFPSYLIFYCVGWSCGHIPHGGGTDPDFQSLFPLSWSFFTSFAPKPAPFQCQAVFGMKIERIDWVIYTLWRCVAYFILIVVMVAICYISI